MVIPIICHEAFKVLKNMQHGANYHKHGRKNPISLRSDDSFKLYWQKISGEAEELKAISKPKLPRKRRVPKRLDDGTAPGDHPPTVEDHYRSIYFQTLDVVINCIESRFDQLGYRSYSRLESLLLKAASKKNFTEDFMGAHPGQNSLILRMVELIWLCCSYVG